MGSGIGDLTHVKGPIANYKCRSEHAFKTDGQRDSVSHPSIGDKHRQGFPAPLLALSKGLVLCGLATGLVRDREEGLMDILALVGDGVE